jgi:hypothetical protein
LQDYEAVLKMVQGQRNALEGWQRVRNAMLGNRSLNSSRRFQQAQAAAAAAAPAADAPAGTSKHSSSSSSDNRRHAAVQAADQKFRDFCAEPDMAYLLQQPPTTDLLLQNAQNIGRCVQHLQDFYHAAQACPDAAQACGNSSIAAVARLTAWCQQLLPVFGLSSSSRQASAASVEMQQASMQLVTMWYTSAGLLVEFVDIPQHGGSFESEFARVQEAAAVLEGSGGKELHTAETMV